VTNESVLTGPPAKAMWALGDKIASTIVAQTAGVPTMAWSGSALKIDYTDEDLAAGKKIVVPPHLYAQATVLHIEDGLKVPAEPFSFYRCCISPFTQIVSKIGFPVMIKASEGGGGKGIRKCQHYDDFATQFRQVRTT